MNRFEKDVEEVINIAREATLKKLPPFEKTAFEETMDKVINSITSHAILAFTLMIVLALLTYFFQTTPLLNTTVTVGAITAALGWAIQIAVVIGLAPSLWEIRKNPYGQFFRLINRAAVHDLAFIDKLKKYEPAVLRFVLSQYKFERFAFEKRSTLISGSIEKIGFFPALATLLVLSVTLVKAPFMENWAHPLVFLLFAFYVLNVAAFAMQQKMDAVITLMEYCLTVSEEEAALAST